MKIYNVGVIGSGSISDIYLKNMIENFDNLNVLKIASKHFENAKKKADEYHITACSVEEIVKDDNIDIVVVLTPVESHFELIRFALLNGKHVYTEKVITDSMDKTKELIDIANGRNLYLGSAPDTFLGSSIQTAKKIIESGSLGRIHSFVISSNRNNNILLSIFSFLNGPCGDIVNDYGVYYLTALVYLLGCVKKVASISKAPYLTHENIYFKSDKFETVMDTKNASEASAVLVLENGITGTFNITGDSVAKEEVVFNIYGENGILKMPCPNDFGGKIKYISNVFGAEEKELINFSPYCDNSRGLGVSLMAKAISENTRNFATKELALHVSEVLGAIVNAKDELKVTEIESRCEVMGSVQSKSPGILNIAHLAFNMKNVEEMLDFYRNTLGLKEAFTLRYQDILDNITDKETYEKYRKILIPKNPWITYFKMGENQFIELFFEKLENSVKDCKENYGYTKFNIEVSDIESEKKRLIGKGVSLKEDIHTTVDGSREFTILDPDGNEIQFTEYSNVGLLKNDPFENSCITQVAYQVKDDMNMLDFYTLGLGLKKVATLSFDDLAKGLRKMGASKEQYGSLRMLGSNPWIDYIEVSPHQYMELFHTGGNPKNEHVEDITKYNGFQHMCLEVEDIHKAYDAMKYNGIQPENEPSLGIDGSYQFWIADPDGNRIEVMQYTKGSLQVKKE